jgi:hypothetical protein
VVVDGPVEETNRSSENVLDEFFSSDTLPTAANKGN